MLEACTLAAPPPQGPYPGAGSQNIHHTGFPDRAGPAFGRGWVQARKAGRGRLGRGGAGGGAGPPPSSEGGREAGAFKRGGAGYPQTVCPEGAGASPVPRVLRALGMSLRSQRPPA